MSQKKMEAYKEAKKNVKKIRQKEKRNRIIAWIVGIVCAAALIGGSVFLIYYTNVIKPQQEAAAEAQETEDGNKAAQELINYIQSNPTTGDTSDTAGSGDSGETTEAGSAESTDSGDAATTE